MSPARPRGEVEWVWREISRAQEEAVREFRPDVSKVPAPSGADSPLLARERIRPDWGRFERLLGEILGILEKWSGKSAGEVHFPEDRRGALLSRALKGEGELEKLGIELGADPAVFAFAVRSSLAPFLGAYARALESGFDPESVLGRRCPVCGGEPFMAEFDGEDGRRRLQCGLCRTRWRFPRMKCPFCGSEDQEAFGFLEVEGLEGYRADTCDACRRYVKTLDRRRVLEPVSLELADALSPELDEAARERGYGLRLKAGKDDCGFETG